MSEVYAKMGPGAKIGDYVTIGEKGKESRTIIGENANIRSHTIIYPGNTIGNDFSTGHGAVIRENNRIGNHVSIGTRTVIERDSVIMDNVRIHTGAFIPEYTVLCEGCWIGPHVTFTNAVRPLAPGAKELMRGPTIGKNAKIGAGSVVLPYVVVGDNAIVGAGSVVASDVPKGAVVVGNPAKQIKNEEEVTWGMGKKESASIKRSIPSVSSSEIREIARVVASRHFINGNEIKLFEKEFTAYTGTEHAIGVNSGTSALLVSFMAMGLQGKEVITVPNSFMASANAIQMAGAKAVFVDVDEKTFNMDASKIEAAITKNTAAILPVHLYGQPADMGEILAIAKKHGLKVIEDACQAHGSAYGGRKAGSIGDAAAFSFFPTKNMTVFGDGGMITTNDADVAKKARMLRDNGRLEAKDDCSIFGMNNRLSEIMAAVGREQLKRLDGFNRRRAELAKLYKEQLEGVGDMVLPTTASGRTHVYHLYTIRTKRRDALKDTLKQNGIECTVMYPIPIHRMTAYKNAGYKCGLPVAERLASEILSIPMHSELTDSAAMRVCEVIKGFYKGQVEK